MDITSELRIWNRSAMAIPLENPPIFRISRGGKDYDPFYDEYDDI